VGGCLAISNGMKNFKAALFLQIVCALCVPLIASAQEADDVRDEPAPPVKTSAKKKPANQPAAPMSGGLVAELMKNRDVQRFLARKDTQRFIADLMKSPMGPHLMKMAGGMGGMGAFGAPAPSAKKTTGSAKTKSKDKNAAKPESLLCASDDQEMNQKEKKALKDAFAKRPNPFQPWKGQMEGLQLVHVKKGNWKVTLGGSEVAKVPAKICMNTETKALGIQAMNEFFPLEKTPDNQLAVTMSGQGQSMRFTRSKAAK
jgi:hypothetical protein